MEMRQTLLEYSYEVAKL